MATDIEKNHVSTWQMIEEYEKVIEALQTQIAFYELEQSKLRIEVTEIVNENKALRLQLQDELTKTKDLSTNNNSDQIINLQNQISFINKEKQSVLELWQVAQSELDRMEQEIHENPQLKEFRTKIQVLEQKLALKSEVQSTDEEVSKVWNQNNLILNQVETLQLEVESLEEKVTTITICRDELQNAVNASQSHISELRSQNIEQMETISSIDRQCKELMKLKNLLEIENGNLRQTLNDIIEEAGLKVTKETKRINLEYEAKLQCLMADLDDLQKAYENKCKNFDNLMQRNQILEAKFDENSDVFDMEMKLKSMVERLVLVERENVELKAVNKTLEINMAAMSDGFQRDIEIRNYKEVEWKNQIQVLQEGFNKLNREYVVLIRQCQNLSNQLRTSQQKVAKYKKKEEIYLKLGEKLQKLDEKQNMNSKYLESHLEMQIELNQRYGNETQALISKFKDRLQILTAENDFLKQSNEDLQNKLEKSNFKVQEYIRNVQLV